MATLGLHCCARALSRCGAQASHCSGFSHRGAQALGAWAQWLRFVGSRALALWLSAQA